MALRFGDYTLTKARGRWVARCYRCRYTSPPKFYIGHAQECVFQHVRDAHHKAARRDVREAQRW
jgi:hypothetical protein